MVLCPRLTAKVVYPTRWLTGFHHDEGDGVLLEDRRQIISICGYVKNSNFLVFVSNIQQTDLNYPKSSARIFLVIVSLGLELESFVTVVVNSDPR